MSIDGVAKLKYSLKDDFLDQLKDQANVKVEKEEILTFHDKADLEELSASENLMSIRKEIVLFGKDLTGIKDEKIGQRITLDIDLMKKEVFYIVDDIPPSWDAKYLSDGMINAMEEDMQNFGDRGTQRLKELSRTRAQFKEDGSFQKDLVSISDDLFTKEERKAVVEAINRVDKKRGIGF